MLHAALLFALAAFDDAPSPEIQKLLGPTVAMGKGGALDEIALKRGREFADQLPIKSTIDLNGDGAIDTTDAYFYDLPLILYRTYYRTGD